MLPGNTFARRLLPAALLLLAALLPLSGVCAADAQAPIAKRARKNAGAIRVVSANIRADYEIDFKTGDNWAAREQLCLDVLLAQDADIFCFQEMRANSEAFLKKHLAGYELYYAPKSLKNAIAFSTARFEKKAGGGFWLSDTPEVPGSHFPGSSNRLANWVLLRDKLTGREFKVWNTHLQHDSEPLRDRQAADEVVRAQLVLEERVRHQVDEHGEARHRALRAAGADGGLEVESALVEGRVDLTQRRR
ncbi:MAG: hypothetical protein LBM92_00945, partial [Opitutaceae bacterium]|nr:hypothetical protein [Opitutaceae bacterium]